MARCRALFLLGALAFAALVNSAVQSFVGTSGVVSARLRATAAVEADQRYPEVAMQFFGGFEPATTTPPPAPTIVEDPGTYIIGISLLMIASVFANTSGFFGPWAK
mmetsp:Transcript_98657/g.265069  ORF Transcript_98657/g.265069 Transcript_98657/m.265069 type:complete len:106 (+) Transcript_98657:128-445(+)